jgi:hypothetical protein
MFNVVKYVGTRQGAGARVERVHSCGSITPLDPRHDLHNHSPTGFNWGYGGSGPSQLALALLADVFGDEIAESIYHDYKWSVIALIEADTWETTPDEIRRWRAERAALPFDPR